MNALFPDILLFLEGTLAGMFVGSTMIEHAARTLEAPHWIAYKQAKERVFGPVMPIFFGLTFLLSIVTAVVQPFGAARIDVAILYAIVFGITAAIHLPLNKAIQSWSPEAYPADWDKVRRRWRNWNLGRCVLAVIAFALALSVAHG